MLAQSFKTAKKLGISEKQKEALMKTLVLLETDKLVYADASGRVSPPSERKFTGHFNMEYHYSQEECGTVCCICGTAELVGVVKFDRIKPNIKLWELFYPTVWPAWRATTEQAATALRSYLTTGDARWDLAIA